jgi:hypothetical protein
LTHLSLRLSADMTAEGLLNMFGCTVYVQDVADSCGIEFTRELVRCSTACIEVTHGVTKVRRECEEASMARHACGDEERDI